MKSHYDSKQTKIHEAVRKHYEEHLSKKPDAGFIIDYEILSKFCLECTLKKNKLENKKITEETYNTWKTKHDADGSCGSNYEGPSGGMEVEAARRLFARSRDLKFERDWGLGSGNYREQEKVDTITKTGSKIRRESPWRTQQVDRHSH
ncbi:hypothetical protein O3P69_017621 [Scylla paramamosain]|uniref:Mutator-like transposase domain-containing protein n=1 Tax=Scylla paramamosain TaxID=85552 RepID=A0AAW0TZP3_SCYPA